MSEDSSVLIVTEHSETQAIWDKSAWIGCGKHYSDIPPVVQHQRKHILQVPAQFQSLLPSADASVKALLNATIPLSADEDMYIELILEFSDREPVDPKSIENETLLENVTPSLEQLIRLERNFGQKWFNGAHSVYSREADQYQVEQSRQCLIRLPCAFAIAMFLMILSLVQPNSCMQLSIETTHWDIAGIWRSTAISSRRIETMFGHSAAFYLWHIVLHSTGWHV